MATQTQQFQGIVLEFDRSRGMGVIALESGERASVRYSAIQGEGVRTLSVGDRVSFDLETTSRGLAAVHVVRN
jgi:cold shock CspA family protein